MTKELNMNINYSLVLLVALLCVGYVLQNVIIYNLRKTLDKQTALSEKQLEVSQMMVDAIAKVSQLKGCK
jgi:ABC-type thiamin/hydroxymethylpyrimidine transport system permease subunit